MKLGMILSQTEPKTVFNALRLANYSLKHGDSVKIFLVGKGVGLDRIKDPKFDVQAQRERCWKEAGSSWPAGLA